MTAAVSAEAILKDLHALWASVSKESSASEGHGVLRACSMTVIVLADEADDPAGISRTLGQVMQDHPHRAIVVRVRSGSEPHLDYRVTAQCWMALGRQRQICCEQVEMTVADASLTDAVPVLFAITAPDLPVAVWRRSPRLFGLPELDPLFARADRVIVDTRDFPDPRAALDSLSGAAGQRPDRLADLAWASVTRWREMVAEIFEDPARRESIPSLARVRVTHAAGPAPTTAFYLAGWIESALAPQAIEAVFEAAAPDGGGIVGIELASERETISISRAVGSSILIEIGARKSCTSAPRLSEAELLGIELSIAGRDPVFEKTLPLAARLAAQTRT